jgi:hypothetical protein
MLTESPCRLVLLTSNQERQVGWNGDDEEADRDNGRQPVSWWDKVAERWPNGGRFPSFISIDQSV